LCGIFTTMRHYTAPTIAARLGIFFLFLAMGFAASAQAASAAPGRLPSVAALLGETTAAELASGGKATRTDTHGFLGLLPKDAAAESLRALIAADKPAILVESVFTLPRVAPEGAAGIAAEMARIYGLMRSFSSLEGIEYYSASRKKMRTFYAESWPIADAETKTRLPDLPAPEAGAIPATERITVWQKDLTFGGNVYSYDFASSAGTLRVMSTNLTRMSYGPIPLIAPLGLKSRLLVIQAEDAIVFYVESDAKAPGLFSGRIGESFSNRAAALFAWFSDRLPKYR